ncbi:MAG: Rieske 2Fe-2S domain-containing protein, partial [Proteobacteria bacterium]|nr:Rieske 2Fe-2S domain-containing protein [Pseudomonadota bacterium]
MSLSAASTVPAAPHSTSPRALPAWVYRNAEMTRLEMQRLIGTSWQILCHVSDLPRHGDYVTLEIANESIFAVRDREGGIRAFHNVCRHRGAKMLDGHGN